MRISYEKAKEIKKRVESGESYKKIKQDLGISEKTISKYSKLSWDEIELLKKKKTTDDSLTLKAKKAMLKEFSNIIAEESLREVRKLIEDGKFLRDLEIRYSDMQYRKLYNMLRDVEFKRNLLKIATFMFLRNEIDRERFLRLIMVS